MDHRSDVSDKAACYAPLTMHRTGAKDHLYDQISTGDMGLVSEHLWDHLYTVYIFPPICLLFSPHCCSALETHVETC